MLRLVSISLLIFLYTLSTCRVFVSFLHYAVDKEFYAERCVNKDKPELECDGCCQVVKEVQEETQKEQSPQSAPTNTDRQTQSEVHHISRFTDHLPLPQILLCIMPYYLGNHPLAEGFSALPFQPPRA
ncbi:MAG: hypothetical protein H9535_03485 [Ignavibacteria bacterium]|nr:hypothetical protein [Ignavibacteria bacterium]